MSLKGNQTKDVSPGVCTDTPLKPKNNEPLRDRWLAAIEQRNKALEVNTWSSNVDVQLTKEQLEALHASRKQSKTVKRRSLPASSDLDLLVSPLPTAIGLRDCSPGPSSKSVTSIAVTTTTNTVTTAAGGCVVTVGVNSTVSAPVPAVAAVLSEVEGLDTSMGQLRNGKIYSPSRQRVCTPKTVSRRGSPYEWKSTDAAARSDKRKLSGSPTSDVLPDTKKQGIVSSEIEGGPEQGIEMEIGAEVEVPSVGVFDRVESNETVLHTGFQLEFIKELKSMMSTTLDKITKQADDMSKKNEASVKAMTEKNNICLKSVEGLTEVVESQGKSITALQAELRGVRGELSNYQKQLDAHQVSRITENRALEKRVVESETKLNSLSEPLDNEAQQKIGRLENRIKELEMQRNLNTPNEMEVDAAFPLDKTIMMVRVYIKDGMNPWDVVKLVIHEALQLSSVTIVNVADIWELSVEGIP